MLTTECLYYYVHLDSQKFPILGTMFAVKGNNKLQQSYSCSIGKVLGVQQYPAPGHAQCFKKGNIRYYYRTKQDGTIIPNSMFEHIGTQNLQNQCIIEYKTFS